MAQEQDLPEEVTRSVATEINFLRLPIFTTSKSDGERQTDRYDYGIHNDRFQIEITHERNLTAYDRKMLLAIEYLYLRQNPSFESNMVVTTFKEVADVLGMSASNTQKIYESLSKLRSVEIKTMLKVRRDQRDYDVKSEFNLLYRITRVQSESSTGGPTRTNRVEIVLNDWHVENFRNRYYRVVNMGLVAQLRSGIAVRLFDYLNYTVFYYDSKAGRYRQKMNTEIPYIALVEYLHISPQRGIKNIRKQFATALKELREKGVIQDWQFERRSNDVYLKLTLARSINWREVTSEKPRPDGEASRGNIEGEKECDRPAAQEARPEHRPGEGGRGGPRRALPGGEGGPARVSPRASPGEGERRQPVPVQGDHRRLD
jgi:hypothetical protein